MRLLGVIVGVALATQLMAACANVDRSLIFFTNTTTGLEVSTGSASTDPVRIIVGYKRQEGVLNPVYDKDGIDIVSKDTSGHPVERVKKYRDEAYSVIAKYQGGASAGAGGASASSTNGQWFATGRAATLLAEQPGIAGAVTGNSAVADAAAKQAQTLKITDATREANLSLLINVDEGMERLGKDGDKDAQALRDRLVALDAAPYRPDFIAYSYNYKPEAATLSSRPYEQPAPPTSFRHVITLWDALNLSIAGLRDALTSGSTLTEPPATTAITQDRRSALTLELSKLETLRTGFEDKLSREPAVVDAVDYFVKAVRVK